MSFGIAILVERLLKLLADPTTTRQQKLDALTDLKQYVNKLTDYIDNMPVPT